MDSKSDNVSALLSRHLNHIVASTAAPSRPVVDDIIRSGRRRIYGRAMMRSTVVAAVLVVVAGGYVFARGERGPDPATGLGSCGSMPAPAAGPTSGHLSLTIVGPAEVPPGGEFSGQVKVTSTADVAKPFSSGTPPELLILQDSQVVGRYGGVLATIGVERNLEAGASVSFPASIRMAGCPDFTSGDPDASRRDLPSGTYQLVALMDDVTRGGGVRALVSAPLEVRVL